jgi:hypothetical protein
MTPPHTDPSDGTNLAVSFASTIAVDYVAVFFILDRGISRRGCFVWGCNGRRRRSGCARFCSHKLDRSSFGAQFFVGCTGETLDPSLAVGPECGQRRGLDVRWGAYQV